MLSASTGFAVPEKILNRSSFTRQSLRFQRLWNPRICLLTKVKSRRLRAHEGDGVPRIAVGTFLYPGSLFPLLTLNCRLPTVNFCRDAEGRFHSAHTPIYPAMRILRAYLSRERVSQTKVCSCGI